mmetsp:Transcript_6977/g.7225  ORF Transcript_6977/g.7225 Transcript_6977/m.7225 type:complete len:511 (+) Transcript_6977:196-1728(+)
MCSTKTLIVLVCVSLPFGHSFLSTVQLHARNSFCPGIGIYRSALAVLPAHNEVFFNLNSNILSNFDPSIIRGNQWFVWSIASSAAAMGLHLEKTAVGRSLSGPVCAMLISATLTNLNILPHNSIHLQQLTGFVVRLATPLLLLGADFNKIRRETGTLLTAFLLGSLCTVLGSTVAYILLLSRLNSVGLAEDGWKIVSALTAKNIGGGLNFMAVADALGVSPSTVSAGLTVDNLAGLLYFPLISWLGTPYEGDEMKETETDREREREMSRTDTESHNGEIANENEGDVSVETCHLPLVSDDKIENSIGKDNTQGRSLDEASLSVSLSVENVSTVLALSLAIVAVSELLGPSLGLPSTSLSTLLSVSLATLCPALLSPLTLSGDLIGRALLLLFFGAIGNSAGTLSSVLTNPDVPVLLLFNMLLYTIHVTTLLGVGHLLGMHRIDLLIASNANVGNAATASALASAKKWTSRLLPAMLVGTCGNAIGSLIGLCLGQQFYSRLASCVERGMRP